MHASATPLPGNKRLPFSTLVIPAAAGAGIALALMALFLTGVDQPDPSWPRYWMIRPLVIVTLAGAAGGVFVALLRPLRARGGWTRVAVVALSIAGYLLCVWMGSVLGLDGTLWN